MADDEEEKTEEPTSKKIEKAKEEGNVPKSAETVGAAILVFGTVYLLFFASYTYNTIQELMVYIYNFIGQEINEKTFYNITYFVVNKVLLVLGPFFAIVLLFALILNYAQFGFLVTPLKFDLQKIDPIKGLKNIFSLKKLLEALKLTAKLTIIVIVMTVLFAMTYKAFLAMMDKEVKASMDSMFILLVYFLAAILFIVVVFAIIDFFFTRHYYFKSLRMSKQEVKDEHKNLEGDPKVKGRIRKIQYEMHRKRMMSSAEDADVVITNPTHYAVGLKYDNSTNQAPKVVAKGVDYLALKIRDIAKENDIPIIENPSLARALHDQIEVEQEVPSEFYKALAEIFSYVYELNKNKR